MGGIQDMRHDWVRGVAEWIKDDRDALPVPDVIVESERIWDRRYIVLAHEPPIVEIAVARFVLTGLVIDD
jgi:hypothetical protein